MSSKLALIIGNSHYQDVNLAKLVAPTEDVGDLAAVLRAPEIGGFDQVMTLIDESDAAVRLSIEDFFAEKKPDDLLVLYFSGHGVRDEQGRLYLAAPNTRANRLRATAIAADFITAEMDRSRSKRQVLILDCCHSGAFAQGSKAETGGSVGTGPAFEGTGYGRVVLTATDATQYAWEGDQIIGEADNSVFTHYLVQGLQTGEADVDADGRITLDELYDYVYGQVVARTPRQTPGKWSYKQQGDMVIARNPKPIVKPVELPADLRMAIESPLAHVRVGAVRELDRLLSGSNAGLVLAAFEAIQHLVEDDSRSVSSAASNVLNTYAEKQHAREAQERAAQERAEQERIAKAKAEAERQAVIKAERERIAAERAESERQGALKTEADRQAAIKAEQDRIAKERAEAERQAALKAEQDRIAAEKAEQDRLAAERAGAEQQAVLKAEQDRIAVEKARQEQLARDAERAEQEHAEAGQQVALKAEEERAAQAKALAERLEQQQLEQERERALVDQYTSASVQPRHAAVAEVVTRDMSATMRAIGIICGGWVLLILLAVISGQMAPSAVDTAAYFRLGYGVGSLVLALVLQIAVPSMKRTAWLLAGGWALVMIGELQIGVAAQLASNWLGVVADGVCGVIGAWAVLREIPGVPRWQYGVIGLIWLLANAIGSGYAWEIVIYKLYEGTNMASAMSELDVSVLSLVFGPVLAAVAGGAALYWLVTRTRQITSDTTRANQG